MSIYRERLEGGQVGRLGKSLFERIGSYGNGIKKKELIPVNFRLNGLP